MGLESTDGGALTITAGLPKSGVGGAIIGQVQATDFTVQNAPFLSQILSLAALIGIVDTLSGEGLGFEVLAFDFVFEDRVLSVRDATLRGPAIGMRARETLNSMTELWISAGRSYRLTQSTRFSATSR